MIQKADGKIGGLEAGSILFILMAAKVADPTMAFFLHSGETAAWLINLLAGLLTMISFLILLSVIKKYPDQSLMEINTLLLGKYAGFIVNFILFMIILTATVYHAELVAGQLSNVFLLQTPTQTIAGLAIVILVFIAMRGYEEIGRVSWIFTPLFLFSFFLLFVLISVSDIEVNWRYIFPILSPGIEEIMKQSVLNSAHYGEVILFAAFIPYIRTFAAYKKSSLIVLIYTILATSLFLFISIAIYNFPTIGTATFPFINVSKSLNIGRFMYNVESTFLFVVLLGALIRFSTYVYLTTLIFAKTFRINEFEPLIIPMAFIKFLMEENIQGLLAAFRFRKIALQYDWIILLFLPVILWLLSRWKERRKYDAERS